MNEETVQVNQGTPAASRPPAAVGKAPDPTDLMAVVARFQGPLLRFVGHSLGRIDPEAEDVVQEVFIRLHRQVARRGPASVKNLSTWLFRVAHNLTIDLLRKRSRKKRAPRTNADTATLSGDQAADEMDALGEVLRQEARQVALAELGRLDEEYRQVVLLKIIQGMTLRQVAEVIGGSVSLVNQRLNRGLAELARRLRKAGVV